MVSLWESKGSGIQNSTSQFDSLVKDYSTLRERRSGSVVSASDLGPEDREFEPWPGHPRCVLRQNTELSQCLSLSTQVYQWEPANLLWGQPDKMLGGNL